MIMLSLFQQPVTQGPGIESFNSHLMEILLMLTVSFILGYLLRYFLGAKWRNRVAELEAENSSLQTQLANLQTEYDDCQSNAKSMRAKNAALNAKVHMLEKRITEIEIPNEVEVAPIAEMTDSKNDVVEVSETLDIASSTNDSGFGGSINYADIGLDNLQIVEGIGPKLEQILKTAGINNWSDLANSNATKLREILDNAGPRYRIHDPETWAKQASYAVGEDWDGLIEYQNFLGGGKTTGPGIASGSSKLQKLAIKLLGATYYTADDLKVVEGIGPKTESLLKEAGINNWEALANTDVNSIRQILESGGDRFRLSDPATWPKQARMAAEGNWKKLEEYQDYLQGGKDLGS